MKKMIRKALPLVFAMMIMAVSAEGAFAGSVNGTVTYDGSGVDLAYSTADINSALSSLTPGDDVELVFALNNTSGKATDWYVEDNIIRAFEDGSGASDGAYTYSLTYRSPDGSVTDIYTNDVGGSGNDSSVPAGLHQATSGSEKYFYLDRIEAGKSGSFALSISIDGETLDNSYQSSLADLGVNFAVEVPGEESSTVTTSPGTGDYTPLATYMILFVIAALLLAGTGILALRLRRKGGSDE